MCDDRMWALDAEGEIGGWMGNGMKGGGEGFGFCCVRVAPWGRLDAATKTPNILHYTSCRGQQPYGISMGFVPYLWSFFHGSVMIIFTQIFPYQNWLRLPRSIRADLIHSFSSYYRPVKLNNSCQNLWTEE